MPFKKKVQVPPVATAEVEAEPAPEAETAEAMTTEATEPAEPVVTAPEKEKESTDTPTTSTETEATEKDTTTPEPAPDAAATAPPTATATATPATTAATNGSKDDTDAMKPGDRDVVIGEGSAEQKVNLLLQDVIRLHRVVYALKLTAADAADEDEDKKEEEINKLVDRLVKLITKGKDYELAGWKEVPKSYMKSIGRFMQKEDGVWKEMSDKEAKEELIKIVKAEFDSDVATLAESPYKEFREIILRKPSDEDPPVGTPEAKDVILLHCEGPETDKIFDQQSSNKAIFNLASQLVTSYSSSPEKRVEAALTILQGIDQAEILMDPNDGDKNAPASAPTSKVARFLVRAEGGLGTSATAVWSVLDNVDAIEFLTVFVFEVYLEKEIHVANALAAAADAPPGPDTSGPGTDPIHEPTDHDVLFGRGGMTNSHVGNRRFRDVITLHRPDYIRAIKMDKPGVARKIVKAIRLGDPPGRFLRKGDDGKWYDVGDRTAAEKTSQGLRERSNVEKRQRSALREALRIRKEDMPDDDGSPSAKKARTDDLGAAELAAATTGSTLNYTGTNLAIPLSLSMKEATKPPAKKKAPKDGKEEEEELNCEGLPPNATDEEGNVLVTDYDILCGRGGLTNHHKGNKRFRDVVALHRPDYVRAPKIQKPSVARVIVRAIRNGDPPGRFIRKDDKTGKWIDIGDKKAAEKTSQALREKTNEERDQLKTTPGSLGVLLPNPASFLAAATASMATGISALPPAKKPEEAKTDESKADDDKEKTNDMADEEAGDKEGDEKTADKEKKDDDKEEEGSKEESKEEKEPEKEPISADGETALV